MIKKKNVTYTLYNNNIIILNTIYYYYDILYGYQALPRVGII